MVEENINVLDEFEIAKDDIAVFLPGIIFYEIVLDKVKLFILLHAQENNNRPIFPYWKYSRFDLVLLDDEVYTAKLHLIFSCFWNSLTLKTLNCNVISSITNLYLLLSFEENSNTKTKI